MTPAIFEQAFKPDATPEQIELVNRAVAKVEGYVYYDGWNHPQDVNYPVEADAPRYVQDANNSNRVIGKAIVQDPVMFTIHLGIILGDCDVPLTEHGARQLALTVATAPQSARLYAAYKTLGGE